MSVRAYKIIEIKTENDPSFNCWHDEQLVNIANTDQYSDGGIITIQQDDAEELLETLSENKTPSEEDLITIENVKQVIKDCKSNNGIAEYLCY